MMENERTKKLVLTHLKSQSKKIDGYLKSKEMKGNKGLQILKKMISK